MSAGFWLGLVNGRHQWQLDGGRKREAKVFLLSFPESMDSSLIAFMADPLWLQPSPDRPTVISSPTEKSGFQILLTPAPPVDPPLQGLPAAAANLWVASPPPSSHSVLLSPKKPKYSEWFLFPVWTMADMLIPPSLPFCLLSFLLSFLEVAEIIRRLFLDLVPWTVFPRQTIITL